MKCIIIAFAEKSLKSSPVELLVIGSRGSDGLPDVVVPGADDPVLDNVLREHVVLDLLLGGVKGGIIRGAFEILLASHF